VTVRSAQSVELKMKTFKWTLPFQGPYHVAYTQRLQWQHSQMHRARTDSHPDHWLTRLPSGHPAVNKTDNRSGYSLPSSRPGLSAQHVVRSKGCSHLREGSLSLLLWYWFHYMQLKTSQLRYVIGLENSRHFENQTQSWPARKRFPTIRESHVYLIRVLIGSLTGPLWLAKGITLLLAFTTLNRKLL